MLLPDEFLKVLSTLGPLPTGRAAPLFFTQEPVLCSPVKFSAPVSKVTVGVLPSVEEQNQIRVEKGSI